MLDRITGLEVFIKVANLGSLSAAARALGMSQTMATKHMAALEARLGTRLLHRSTRRMTLTEAGRNYLIRAEQILEDFTAAEAAASIEKLEVQGTLRLNAPLSFGINEVAPLLSKLTSRHPKLKIDLGLNDRHIDLIEEGWDLAIRIGTLTSSALIARRLAPCRLHLCAASAYLKKHGTPKTVSDLKSHNCLGYTLARTGGAARWAFGKSGKKSVEVSGSLRANNGDVLVTAAIMGEGVIYQPDFLVAKAVKAGRLRSLTLDHPALELGGIYAVYPASQHPPAKLRAAIDFFVEQWSKTPPWQL